MALRLNYKMQGEKLLFNWSNLANCFEDWKQIKADQIISIGINVCWRHLASP